MTKCPTCGEAVDEKKTPYKMEYQGKVYHFCCGHCQDAFKKNPQKYAK